MSTTSPPSTDHPSPITRTDAPLTPHPSPLAPPHSPITNHQSLLLVILAAHVPLLIAHFKFLWDRPHYQYFPLLIAGVAFLAWRRVQPLSANRTNGGGRLSLGLLLASLLTLAMATAVFSHWLASVSVVLACGGIMLQIAGRDSLRELLPVWLLTWLFVPLPFDLDLTLVSRLQTFTAAASSQVLDVIGVNHSLAGNILELPGRRLLVEEACSGIQSLFSLLACTAFFLVWTRRPAFRACLLLASVALWAVLANVIRLLVVALAYEWFGSDLSSGWRHELLGIVLFGFAFCMVLCTDQLLQFFFAPLGQLSPIVEEQSPLSQLWNRLLADPGESGDRPTLNLDAVAGETPPAGARLTTMAYCGLCLGFLALGIGQAATYIVFKERHLRGVEAADTVNRQTLPERIGNWRQVDYRTEDRNPGTNWGEHSKVWTFNSTAGSAIVSCDYPFQSWHNLLSCYGGSGWDVEKSTPIMRATPATDGKTRFMEAEMTQPTGQHAYLVFGLIDTGGQDLTPTMFDDSDVSPLQRISFRARGSIERGLSRGLFGVLTGKGAGQLTATSFQFQLFLVSDSPITKADRDEARRNFLEVRERFRDHWAESVGRRAESGESRV